MPQFSLLTFALLSAFAGAQSLARPNWTGSGLTVEPWYTHAVLYSVDPGHYTPEGTLAALTARLDYIRSLGVDAVVLTDLAAPGIAGNLDDLDTLIREANRDNLRVLIALPASATVEQARVYLTHNASGLSLSVSNPQIQALVRGFPGKRVLLAPASEPKPELILDATLQAAPVPALRQTLEALPPGDIAQSPAALRPEIAATLLLATRANAELLAGQELGVAPGVPLDPAAAAKQDADPASLLNWVRSLIDLHHGSSALRLGTLTFLNHDQENALIWVVRRVQITPQSPAIVFACNLSDKPVKLNLAPDLAALHLRGTFLRPVLRFPSGMGGQSLDAVTLLPHSVFVGELRF